jgi:acid phosphatase
MAVAACSSADSTNAGAGDAGGSGGDDAHTGGGDDSGSGGFDSGGTDGGGADSANPSKDSGEGGQDSSSTHFPAGTICNASSTTLTPPTTFKHVLMILFENKDDASVIGSASAPYMTSIKAKCGYSSAYLDNCFTDDLDSLPHYMALTSGSNCDTGLDHNGTGCIVDDADPGSHTLSTTSIMQQATSYKAYIESMPNACDPNSSGGYATKHNPPPYYDNLSASCAGSDVTIAAISCTSTKNHPCSTPSNAFTQDLANDTLAQFLWVTPNLTNDMHDGTVTQGDNWLATYLPLVLGSPAYLRGEMAVYILWDEQNHFTGGSTPNIFISPYTPPTASTTTTNHFSVLRTVEEQLGITTFLGCAGGTPPGGTGTCPTGSTTSLRSVFNF